ncbi:hypothetical protein C8Q75DRAFT_811664 [Abortiporus biennis]|nr:hypothetical protein C8Q75DRAFT_811664 [Abortiporus biennis]
MATMIGPQHVGQPVKGSLRRPLPSNDPIWMGALNTIRQSSSQTLSQVRDQLESRLPSYITARPYKSPPSRAADIKRFAKMYNMYNPELSTQELEDKLTQSEVYFPVLKFGEPDLKTDVHNLNMIKSYLTPASDPQVPRLRKSVILWAYPRVIAKAKELRRARRDEIRRREVARQRRDSMARGERAVARRPVSQGINQSPPNAASTSRTSATFESPSGPSAPKRSSAEDDLSQEGDGQPSQKKRRVGMQTDPPNE